MTRHLLRSCTAVLLFLVSMSLLACSGNQPNSNQPNSNQSNSNKVNPAAHSGPPAYEGYHDIVNCNAILAWAWDKNRPDDPVKLDIYDGNLLIDTVTADGFRQDLLDLGKGNGKHGMYFAVPPKMKDGKKHIITIKFAGTTVELSNGPKELTCNFE
jgi:hypothetical protein